MHAVCRNQSFTYGQGKLNMITVIIIIYYIFIAFCYLFSGFTILEKIIRLNPKNFHFNLNNAAQQHNDACRGQAFRQQT